MVSEISIIPGKMHGENLPAFLSPQAVQPAAAFHRSMPMYQRTPLVALPDLAKKFGVGNIFVKDESFRFGLHAFKGLGAAYAAAKILSGMTGLDETGPDYRTLTSENNRNKIKDLVFVTATDGNHGKGVAWAASLFGCKAVVFMPKGTRPYRAEAIRSIRDTMVEITDFNYDDTVRLAAGYANQHGCILVQDTGFEGYAEIPNAITQGYTTMVSEALAQLSEYKVEKPTHVFLQAGVGSMAGGVLGYLAHRYHGNPPVTTIVEPSAAACIYESVRTGAAIPRAVGGNPETIMAGLNCGTPNPLIWPILRDHASFFASCPDWVAELGMRTLARPAGEDPTVVSGESGAVGLGLLAALCMDEPYRSYRQMLNLNPSSAILLFSTEGATDPESYRAILSR